MPGEVYDISGLKSQLEDITGKKVYLYDNEEAYKEVDIDRVKLDELIDRAFRLTLKTLAVKNLCKSYLKYLLKQMPGIKAGRQIDDIMRKHQKDIDDKYNMLTMIEELKLK